MRSFILNAFFLSFLFHLLNLEPSDSTTRASSDTENPRNAQDDWNDLLKWFREHKAKESNSNSDSGGFFPEDIEGDVTLEDEAFDETPGGVVPETEWNRLVNGVEASTRDDGGVDNHPEEDPEGELRVRGASLAFVFDSTGSMSDELNQVKAGASKILAALRDHPDAPIYNYIWVPFSDPVIGPMTVTTDHKLFQERMQDVMVFGGGDCPEMSIGAIKKALEASLPNSYIYVFTDASAKDHRLQNEVLSLVQRKQAQVIFILTGDCMDLNEPNYKAYERIAETSSGQIYRLSRKEVKEALKYVKVALQPHVVSLASLNKPAPDKDNPDKLEVVIDESLKQFTVSVSGANATINVTDPYGVYIDGPPKLEEVLNLTNIKVVNVKEPDPGAWSVFINSDSNYTVRSTGLSKLNFNHGFSTRETINLKETNYRPLKGAKSHILIQTSDAEKVYNLTSLDFVSLSGNILQRLPLTPVTGIPGLFKARDFLPPPEFFYLGVSGFGQDGLQVKRITSTAISAQLPEKPIITMRTKAVGRVNSPGFLKCYIESVVPFNVRWYKNGVLIGEEKNCSETCETVLNVEKFTMQSEGIYSCSAKNVAGFDSKSLTLTVLGDAPSVTVNSPVVTSLGETVYLDCLVESKIPTVVKWTQFTAKNQHSGVLHPVSTGTKLENNTLMIESVKVEDEGWYVCNAANRGGESKGRVLLIVKEPLVVRVEPSSLTFVEGDSARFSCSASGKPQPRLEWIKDQYPLKDEDPSIFIEEINGNLNLMIDYLEKKNAGVYICNAVNAEQSASASADLIYTEKATVKAKENNLMVKAGSQVVLQCLATGYPHPTITWFKGENEIPDNPRFQVDEGIFRIHSAHSSDGGEYSCVARNNLGTDVDYIGVIVGSPPYFLQKPRDKKIQINHNGTVTCSVIGVPQPEITWKRSDGRELDATRMIILSSGALRITRMRVEDVGQYVCTAENVFGSIWNQVLIKITGVEKPIHDKNIELQNVEALSGNELTIPCGIMLGNPPAKVKWYKNGVEVRPNEDIILEASGNLVIRNATTAHRGSYLCLAQNAAGNSSRPYEVSISESPKIKESKEAGVKGKIGGEITIPCSVEGFPLPTVTWTKDGLPLPMSSTIFQDESGSLIIRNLAEENGGVYVCTAINAVGSASKATSIHIQVPPVFPTEFQDSAINVVEGHVVVLNCNASATPEPTVRWYKNGEPLLQNGDQPKILRFVANMDDTGVFSCFVENEAGFSTKHFNVTILVPPKILGRNNEESIKAKAGIPMTLICNVFGVPTPTILWQRNGMYLTQNTSEITISDSGALTIENVTKESAGAYTCDAENLGGITQRIYYLQVHYPPKIIEENRTKVIVLKEGEEYSLTCLAEGNPKPNVVWRKNGIPIHGQHHELMILEDNTLVFLQVNKETTGVYKCEAISSEGSAFTEHEIKVLIPPSLTSDSYPTRLEVNEGDSLALTCPTSFSDPPPNIQWIKDGERLDLFLQERSDEAQMKLSFDQRTLTIIETHPSDSGNYSCVATNVAGRTDARFLVDVLMTPHFEEFNHVAHRTILTGGDVVLNCSVSGNPQPKVTWRKENIPVTPHNTPGVHVSLDKQHLMIVNGKVHHTGTYICLATNKVNAKEREFYVTVLDPPQIGGSLQQTIDVMQGDNVRLECEGSGVPAPKYTWMKEDPTKKLLNNSRSYLLIPNASCEDSGIYLCDVTNIAGTRTKYFELNVLEPPRVENGDQTDEVKGVLGGNVTMKCKTSGNPKPEITWLHNGHILRRVKKRAVDEVEENYAEWKFSDDGYVSLTLTDVKEQNRGTYTLLASNRAGVVEKNFNVQVLVPPRLIDGQPEVKYLKVVHPFPVVLQCPAFGDPSPRIFWFFESVAGRRLLQGDEVAFEGDQLRIKKPKADDSGIYVCLAENPAGKITYFFNVTVLEAPRIVGKPTERQSLLVNDTLYLHCNTTGDELLNRRWFHSSLLLGNSSETTVTHSGKTLMIPSVQLKHSGVFTCITTNSAGSAEVTFTVDVHEPPSLSHEVSTDNQKIVRLHRPFSLFCFFTGYPPPEVTWFKDGVPFDPNHSQNSILPGNSYLTFPSSKPEDSGVYKCVARNKVGVREMNFRVDIIVTGEWSDWSAWSQCSVTCGLGEQIRKRFCNLEKTETDPRVKTERCEGDEFTKRNCFKECQVKRNFGSWSSCSVSCGKGVRRRRCEDDEDCKGEETTEEICFERECPVNGQWSEWSNWSKCSDPCGGGVMQRMRKCNSPQPQHGGDECPGWGNELKICNRQKCQHEGRWLPWSDWSPCSSTCGKGLKKRQRLCKESKQGGKCKGESHQTEKCLIRSCHKSKFPSSANLYLKGKLNGNPVNNRFDVNIESRDNERQISANMKDILKRKDKWFPYTPFILSPLSWNTAYEVDEAENGHTLTNGNFFSQSEIQFATGEKELNKDGGFKGRLIVFHTLILLTGEELKVKHKADGVDNNGTLIVEIEVLGEVPLAEHKSYVFIKPMEQDFMQTSSNTLFSSTQNNVTVEGKDVGYIWNSSIRYDDSKGTMPYLVEKLSTKQFSHWYDPKTQNIRFTASSTIGKKFGDNQCPVGFSHDPNHFHCQDINECENLEKLCGNGETCENTFGSFKCVCQNGFQRTENGCLDLDECSIRNGGCSHSCHNTLGSHKCSCPFGFYLGPDSKTCLELRETTEDVFDTEEEDYGGRSNLRRIISTILDVYNTHDKLQEMKAVERISCPFGFFLFRNVCRDYNECEETPNVCDEDETCVNFPGSYKCLSIPCPPGYKRIPKKKNCVKECSAENKCLRGASVSEFVIFRSVNLKKSHPYVVHFDEIGEPQCNVVKKIYKVVEGRETFEVRIARGSGSLFPIKQLNKDTLYRVKIDSSAFGINNVLLYFTEFIVFVVPE